MRVVKAIPYILSPLFGPAFPKPKIQPTQEQIANLPANLHEHVSNLCKLQRHTRNIRDLNKAADYIRKTWERMGLEVHEQIFRGPDGDPNLYRNLIVSFGPHDAERIILGAHYDVDRGGFIPGIDDSPKNANLAANIDRNKISTPGADDNASGIAGIIEVSRLIKENNPHLAKRIDIVAYTTEERPHSALDFEKNDVKYMGSAKHAKSLHNSNAKVHAAIIFEMIGYYSSRRCSQLYPLNILKLIYPSKGNFIGVVGNFKSFELVQKIKSGLQQFCRLSVRSLSIPDTIVPDIIRSDHSSYYPYGIPAIMITDTANFRNPNYHKPTDTPDTLNYEKMADVVQGTFKTILNL